MSKKSKNALALVGMLALVLVFSCENYSGGKLPDDIVTVEIFVSDSVGGTIVNGTELSIVDSVTQMQVKRTSVSNGKAYVWLAPNKKYDFHLLGEEGKWAGSLLQDYSVSGAFYQKINLLQYKHGQITRDVEPPRIKEVKVSNSSGSEIADNFTVDDTVKKVYVKLESVVGAVEKVAWNGFGAKLGIGGVPSSSSGIVGQYTADTSPNDGVFTSEYVYNIEHASLPNGDTELVIVGYDIANNRIEKHIPVKLQKTSAGASLADAKFDEPFLIMERVPFTNNTFSAQPGDELVTLSLDAGMINPAALMPIDGHNSSYMAAAIFGLVNKNTNVPIPIIGFDLLRREKGSTEGFKPVSRTHYDKSKAETRPGWGVHQGSDTSSELEEGKEYEYKIKAFTTTDSIESDILTGKIMEAFTYSLEKPNNRKMVPIANVGTLSYSCKISNPKLLTKEESDKCDFGLLILDGQGQALFGAKLSYIFDDVNPDIKIYTTQANAPKSYQTDLKALLQGSPFYITGLDELVKVDSVNGTIRFTPKFMQIPIFNLINGRPMQYKPGVTYQWDIQDWRGNPYDLSDDRALRFVKMYGGSHSRTMGNNKPSGSNAVNGRFTFTVK